VGLWVSFLKVFGISLTVLVLYRFGRRTVYIAGQLFMGGILGVIGILGIFSGNSNAAYGVGSLLILLNFGYNISVGPLCK
jgi:SP family general alpha glucoside:H+ symporter-like MFS transporter